MPHAIRSTRFPLASTSLLLVIVSCLALSACTTRPLVLQPVIRPLEFAPSRKFEPLHLVSFVDEMTEEERGFGELEKTFQHPPVDVFNDALLLSLRQSQGFEFVDRNQPSIDGGYILEGRLTALGTDERFFKFALAKSTMGITAACVTEFQLKDASTGEVVLEQLVTSHADGYARFQGGGTSFTTTTNSSGQVSHGTATGGGSYDSTLGYENSMSSAISNNVSTITELVLKELRRRAELAEAEADPAANPAEALSDSAATAPEAPSVTQEDPPSVGAPAPE